MFCNNACYIAYYKKEYSGEKSKCWRGGRDRQNQGYIRLKRKGHPMADSYGYVLEHRMVMSEHIGRDLTRTETVHHINGIRDDNRIENLMLFESNSAHQAHHAPERRLNKTCHCGRKHYGRGMCINHYMQWHRRQRKSSTSAA